MCVCHILLQFMTNYLLYTKSREKWQKNCSVRCLDRFLFMRRKRLYSHLRSATMEPAMAIVSARRTAQTAVIAKGRNFHEKRDAA